MRQFSYPQQGALGNILPSKPCSFPYFKLLNDFSSFSLMSSMNSCSICYFSEYLVLTSKYFISTLLQRVLALSFKEARSMKESRPKSSPISSWGIPFSFLFPTRMVASFIFISILDSDEAITLHSFAESWSELKQPKKSSKLQKRRQTWSHLFCPELPVEVIWCPRNLYTNWLTIPVFKNDLKDLFLESEDHPLLALKDEIGVIYELIHEKSSQKIGLSHSFLPLCLSTMYYEEVAVWVVDIYFSHFVDYDY